MTTRNASRHGGSMCDKRRIEIPANLIKDVRLGAIGKLKDAAEMLGYNAENYLMSEAAEAHGVAHADYMDAFDQTRGWQELLDDLGDDFRVEEPVKNIKPTFALKVNSAAQDRADTLRNGLDPGAVPASVLVARAQQIKALEDFAVYAIEVEAAYDAECGDGEA